MLHEVEGERSEASMSVKKETSTESRAGMKYTGCGCGCAQSRLTLCDPMDCNPPGSSVHGISRQEYWSGLPFPPPGDLPDPRIDPTFPMSPELQADSLPTEPSGKPY